MSRKYNLKWNSHHAETVQTFESLRSRELFVDVTLSCDGQFLKAHKLVLSALSGYFERILNYDGPGTPIIHFYGVEMYLLKLLVEFMYHGEVEVPAVDVEKFIEIAENLEVKGLKGDNSKNASHGGVDSGGSIPMTNVDDGLVKKRKRTSQGRRDALYPHKVQRSRVTSYAGLAGWMKTGQQEQKDSHTKAVSY